MGSEELEMAGGGPSQRVDIGLNSLSGRSVQSDQYARNMPGPKRAEPVKKPRPGEGFGDYPDPQKFLGRDRPGFLQNAERDYREGGEGFHLEHRLQKDSGGDVDDRKTLYGGNQMTGLGVGRDQEWGGGERGVGPDADYRDMGVTRGESEVSQSEGTEEEDEDEGDMEGEGGIGDRGRDMGLGGERAIPHSQITALEGRIRQDSMVPSRGVEGFQRPVSDRDRGIKAPSSTSPPFGLYLQPSPQVAGLTFLSYTASPPSGGPMVTHVETNASQNGGVGAGGGGPGIPGPYGMREGGISRDSYAKSLVARDNSMGSSLHEQQNQGHLHETLQSSEENYYTALLSGSNNSSQKGHDLGNEVGGPGLKRSSRMMESHSAADQSLRRILSDPVSGQLMEDATIFACGHSFGNLGLQQVIASNVCLTCGASVRTTSMAANYALRAAVQAFKREEENAIAPKSVKRRRDRPDQDLGMSMEHQMSSDANRSKGVQFPFSVSDRVLIKGNKRTPERFVGREAVITNQCLNGWYLVRTLDNGESVRLQYRSLQKIDQPSPNAPHFGPGWL